MVMTSATATSWQMECADSLESFSLNTWRDLRVRPEGLIERVCICAYCFTDPPAKGHYHDRRLVAGDALVGWSPELRRRCSIWFAPHGAARSPSEGVDLAWQAILLFMPSLEWRMSVLMRSLQSWVVLDWPTVEQSCTLFGWCWFYEEPGASLEQRARSLINGLCMFLTDTIASAWCLWRLDQRVLSLRAA